jgi:protease secretion system outer membrane protein
MAFGSSVHALGLKQAYELALTRDPVFIAAVKDYESGLQSGPIGRAALLPKVAASYNQQNNRTTLNGTATTASGSGPFHYNSNFSAIQLTQPLFNMEALARHYQGQAQVGFAQNKFQYLRLDLAARLLQAYTDVLLAQDQVQFLLADVKAAQEQGQVTRRLGQKGEISQTEALQAQSAAFVAQAKLLEAQADLENVKRKLETMVGQPIQLEKLARPKHDLGRRGPVLPDFAHWLSLAEKGNTELLAMKNQIDIAYQEYKKNQAGHFPVVNLVASTSSQTNNTPNTINQGANQSYVGVQVSVPLFSGGETQARSSQTYLNYQKALADYQVARERVVTELRKHFDLLSSGLGKIQAYEQAYQSEQRVLEAMQKNMKRGEKIFVDVLIARKNVLSTRKELSLSQFQYLMAQLRLQQMAGVFEDADFYKMAQYLGDQ